MAGPPLVERPCTRDTVVPRVGGRSGRAGGSLAEFRDDFSLSSRAMATTSATRSTRRTRTPARTRAVRRGPVSPRFGISRIDSRATHGWFVRLGWHTTRQGKRPRFVSFFPDLRHGGKRKALAAAQTWVSHVLRRGRPPRAS